MKTTLITLFLILSTLIPSVNSGIIEQYLLSLPPEALETLRANPKRIDPKESNHQRELLRKATNAFADANLDGSLARGMLRIESKVGTYMLSPTGCKGYYQFCKRTARKYKLNNPNDFNASTQAAIRLAHDNKLLLKRYGVPDSNFHTYLAHMVGPYSVKLIERLKRGDKLTRKNRNTLRSVILPNWSRALGRKSGNIRTISIKFYNHWEDKYLKAAF